MATTYKEWQSPTTGRTFAKLTDDALLVDGDAFASDVGYPAIPLPDPAVGGISVPDGYPVEWFYMKYGKSSFEGLRRIVCEQQIALPGAKHHDLRIVIPKGALVIAVQGKTMDIAYASGTSTNVGFGISSDPDKYANDSTIPDFGYAKAPTLYPNGFTNLAGAETLRVSATTAAGAAGSGAFTTGRARVRAVYDVLADLDRLED